VALGPFAIPKDNKINKMIGIAVAFYSVGVGEGEVIHRGA
jgi:hypothetical protein